MWLSSHTLDYVIVVNLLPLPLRHIWLLISKTCLALRYIWELIWHHICLINSLTSGPLPGIAGVEAGRHHESPVESHCLRLLEDALQGVDQVVVVLVRLEHVETRQNEFVLLLDQFVQELNIVRVGKMESSKGINVL